MDVNWEKRIKVFVRDRTHFWLWLAIILLALGVCSEVSKKDVKNIEIRLEELERKLK